MRTGCEPTRFGNEAKTIIHGDALAELKKIPAETGHLERVPGDTRKRVYVQFGTLLPDHKSHAVPERARKASA